MNSCKAVICIPDFHTVKAFFKKYFGYLKLEYSMNKFILKVNIKPGVW